MQQRGITHGSQDVQINADLDSNYHTASKSTGFLAKLCQYSFCLLFSKTGLLFFVLIFGQEHVSRLLCEEEGTRKISEQSEPSVDWGGERGGTRSLSTSTINMAAYRFGSLVLGQEQEYPTTFFPKFTSCCCKVLMNTNGANFG